MKKITFMLLSILLLAGCSTIDISNMESYEIVQEILSKNVDITNNVFEGYKIYIPQGLKVIEKNNNNIKISYNNENIYLYVDVVSYYYKEKEEFKSISSNVLSKSIKYNGKVGYINISEVDNKYLLEMVYNYSKIEALVSKETLNDVVLNSTYILSSIRYNDKVISMLIDEDATNYKEEKIDIFGSKGESSSFLEAIEKHDTYTDEEKDQDVLDYEELE